jgi:hypothetical protein
MDTTGNNPPMPTTIGEAATGSIFSSTADSKLDQPQISGRTAPVIEGPLHTATNPRDSLEDYLKKQHITLANFRWSTSQLPGTILYSVPITPLRGNNIMAYYAQLFNAWNGGIEYQTKVAGTGFHAGALGMARIPPNIPPSSLKSVNDFTVFEYSVIDPKTLEAITKYIPDQKQVLYHYMTADLTDPNAIGGYFVVFVILQLNTSSTGSSAIDVQVFNKLNNEFHFHQVIPPSLDPPIPTTTEKWAYLFSMPQLHISPIQVTQCTEILVPTTAGSYLTQGQATVDGDYFDVASWDDVNNRGVDGYPFYTTSATTIKSIGLTTGNDPSNYKFTVVVKPTTVVTAYLPGNTELTVTGAGTAIKFTGEDIPLPATPPTAANTLFSFNLPTTSNVKSITSTATLPSIPSTEQIVLFTSPSYDIYRTTTTMILKCLFRTLNFQFGPNEAVILQLDVNGTPALYVKLNYGGYFTAPKSTTDIRLNLLRTNVTFVSYVGANSPIPPLTVAMRNTLNAFRIEQLLNEYNRVFGGTQSLEELN